MSAPKHWLLKRGTLLRLLLILLAWGVVTGIVAELVPYQPRLRYVAPEGSRIDLYPVDIRLAVISSIEGETNQIIHLESGQSCLSLVKDHEIQIRTPNGNSSIERFDTVGSTEISPNSQFMAAFLDNELFLVNLTTGWYMRQPSAGGFKFSPDSTLVAFPTQKDLKSVMVWDLVAKRARTVLSFKEPLASAVTFRFSQDSRSLLTLHGSNEIGVWNLDTGRQRFFVKEGWYASSLDFSMCPTFDLSPDGETLAYKVVGKAIELLEVASGKVRARLPGACYPLVFSPDGRSLATFTVDGDVKTWEVASGREQNRIPRENPNWVRPYYLDVSGTFLVLKQTGNTTVWDMSVNPAKKIYSFRQETFGPDWQSYVLPRFAMPQNDIFPVQLIALQEVKDAQSSLIVLDLKTLQERLRLPGDYFYPVEPTFSSDSRFLAVHKVLPEQDRPMLALRSLLKRGSVGDAHAVVIWDLATGRRHAVLPGCRQAGFWPDGNSLATLSEEGQAIEVWDVPLRKPLWTILAWSLGLGLYVCCIRWLCGRILRAPARGT